MLIRPLVNCGASQTGPPKMGAAFVSGPDSAEWERELIVNTEVGGEKNSHRSYGSLGREGGPCK